MVISTFTRQVWAVNCWASYCNKPPLPETVKSITRNGYHYIFNHPGLEVRNFVRKDLKDMHFRGDGGYIVAPPSVHETVYWSY